MKRIIKLIGLFSVIIFTAKAQAPDPDTTARHFIIMASIGNLQKISSAQLAVEKAQRADVKSFAKNMIADHSKAQQQLMDIVRNGGFNIPTAATSGIKTDLKLKDAPTSSFDRLYVHAMVADHRSTVQMFQDYAVTGKNPQVKMFAQKTLPILKMHLDMIKAIDSRMKDVAK